MRVDVSGAGDRLPLVPSASGNLPAGLSSSGSQHGLGQSEDAHRHSLGHPMGFSVCHPRDQDRWEGDKPTCLHPLPGCEGLGPGLRCGGSAPTQTHEDRRRQPWPCRPHLHQASLPGPAASPALSPWLSTLLRSHGTLQQKPKTVSISRAFNW